MKLTRADARMLTAFRRTPYSDGVKELLERQLLEARSSYEATMADEGKRAYILAIRAIMDTLFAAQIQVEDSHVQHH